MELKQYLRHRPLPKRGKYKTVNLDDELHSFYKKTASNYNIPISDLMYNILSWWKEKHQMEIMKDMINQLGK